MKTVVIEPHGFCSGVRTAIEAARRMLSEGEPVWCLHELVHNGTVVAELRGKGMRFVESLDDVPEGARVLLSAHKKMSRKNGMTLTGVTDSVKEILDVTGFTDILTIR